MAPRAASTRSGFGKGLRPAYLLLGDEAYFRDRFVAELRGQVDPASWEYAFSSADLGEVAWPEILDQARSPSLLAPLQIFLLENAEQLASRGAAGFAEALAAFTAAAGEAASSVLVFIARRVHIPADPRQMGFEDRARLEKLEALFAPTCEIVRCAQADASTAARILAAEAKSRQCALEADAGPWLLESCGGDLARAVEELEKLALFAGGSPISAQMIRTLVPEAPSPSLEELWGALARKNRAAALRALDQIWAAEGDGGAIGLVFQLSRFCKMALIARQERARDRRRLYEVLPSGLRPPGFAAETVLALAQANSSPELLANLDRLQRADVLLREQPLAPQQVLEDIIIQWSTGKTVVVDRGRIK